MKTKIKLIGLIIISILTMMMLHQTVFADDDDMKESAFGSNGNGYTDMKDVFLTYGPGTEHEDSKVCKYLHESATEDGVEYKYCVNINGKDWWYRLEDEDEVIKLGDRLDKKVLYAKNDKDSLRRFNDATDDKSINADSKKAEYILEGFIDVVTIVLGFIVVLISVGITVTTALDIGFIVLPLWRAEISGIKWLQSKNSKDGDNKIRIISDDAQYAVNAAETIKTGENPLVLYFKSRIFTYMILAVLLYILIAGKITLIAQWALKIVSGILNILGQL